MISFATPTLIGDIAEITQSFACDNGAFSAWKSGKPITDWAKYYAWIEEICLHPGFDWALIPDIIDGSEGDNDEQIATWCNDAKRREIGVPVWHLHESLDRLECLVEGFPRRWSRVALGSSGDFSKPGSRRWWNRIAEAMEIACDKQGRPRVKLHGLRMLNPVIFSWLPLASADSTNAGYNAGLDQSWRGPYQPVTPGLRAAVIMERTELHAAASHWTGPGGIQENAGLLG